jgi:subtilisin
VYSGRKRRTKYHTFTRGSVSAITVGAVNSNEQVADFSSSIKFDRQQDPYEPEIVLPGVNIISAMPGGGVQAMDGTSMATPHLAGTAAILFQAYPNATIGQVEQALNNSCKALNQPELKERYGLGIPVPTKALAELKRITSA